MTKRRRQSSSTHHSYTFGGATLLHLFRIRPPDAPLPPPPLPATPSAPPSDSKIRSTTGRKSAVPQCFQPARFSFLNWLEFCLVEKRIAQRAGRRSGHFEVVSGHFEVVRRQAATAARAPRAAAEGRPGHHQCPSHRRRGGSGADRPSISGGATAVVGAPAGAARRGCHRTGRRAPGGAFVVHGGPSTPASLLGALESRGSCWRRRWDRRRRQQRSRI